MQKKIQMFQVDAFTDKIFSGNPAAICVLDEWMDDELMQKIGAENNLSETAFIVKNGSQFEIRWFTPAVEVDLCGHATLASAHVIYNHLNYSKDEIIFDSIRSGILKVRKNGDLLSLDFPIDKIQITSSNEDLESALNIEINEIYKGQTDIMIILNNQEEVEKIEPDFRKLKEIKTRGVIVTAPGNKVDFVSRFFAPYAGIDEDPVTGSAHTTLTPYWTGRLGKNELTAMQLSKRKGVLQCKLKEHRVIISGKAVTYFVGEILI